MVNFQIKPAWWLGVIITTSLTACTSVPRYGSEPLPPVYNGYPPTTSEVDPYPVIPPPPPPVVHTKPLPDLNRKPEIVEIKPDIPPIESIPPVGSEDVIEPPKPDAPESASTAPAAQPELSGTVSAPSQPGQLETMDTFAPQSPAVGALVMAANESSESGNLDTAASSIERAMRIEPRNPTLYYKLALLRLKQSKPRLAEDLARKAALLAVNDNSLKKHSWLLVANAREQQGNTNGAKAAKAEADKY